MPSSSTIIKAKNVKLLSNNHESALSAADAKGRSLGDVRTKSAMTAQEKDEQRWLEVVDEAKKGAYENGILEGRKLREREFVSAITAIYTAIEEIGTFKKKFYLENEEEMLELAIAIARKVIHTEVKESRDVVLAVLREAVKKITDENGLKVRLNPEDLRFIVEMKQELLQESNLFENAVFDGDAGIKKGGVVLETDHLEVDARLEQQLDKIKKSFKM
jgi:flagellar assembly protein FliH